MTYAVKEIFYTLQGEGAQAGRPSVFCRFAGCNLWSGREDDRPAATCQFCDTDFVGTDGTGGGRFTTAEALADAVASLWPKGEPSGERSAGGRPFVVCTGGEPLLQLDEALVTALHDRGFEVAIETNGTIAPAPAGIDWVCVSPKAGAPLRLTQGDELKLVVPQPGIELDTLEDLQFGRFAVQPIERKPLGELPFGIARRLILDASKTPGWARGGGPHFVAAETVAVASAPVQGTG